MNEFASSKVKANRFYAVVTAAAATSPRWKDYLNDLNKLLSTVDTYIAEQRRIEGGGPALQGCLHNIELNATLLGKAATNHKHEIDQKDAGLTDWVATYTQGVVRCIKAHHTVSPIDHNYRVLKNNGQFQKAQKNAFLKQPADGLLGSLQTYSDTGTVNKKKLEDLMKIANKVEEGCVDNMKKLQTLQKSWNGADKEKYGSAYDWFDRYLTFCKAAATKEFQRLAEATKSWHLVNSYIAYPGVRAR